MGNAVGDKIQGTLAPVGNVAGKGFETAAKPLGGLVEPLVGGLMKSGEAFGEQTGVGFGNAGGGRKCTISFFWGGGTVLSIVLFGRDADDLIAGAQGEARQKELKEGLGGKEANKDNPLGL